MLKVDRSDSTGRNGELLTDGSDQGGWDRCLFILVLLTCLVSSAYFRLAEVDSDEEKKV